MRGVSCVGTSSFEVAAPVRLRGTLDARYATVLGRPSRWTGASVWEASARGGVERATNDNGVSARDDPCELRGARVSAWMSRRRPPHSFGDPVKSMSCNEHENPLSVMKCAGWPPHGNAKSLPVGLPTARAGGRKRSRKIHICGNNCKIRTRTGNPAQVVFQSFGTANFPTP